jgi:hypothetical protein
MSPRQNLALAGIISIVIGITREWLFRLLPFLPKILLLVELVVEFKT